MEEYKMELRTDIRRLLNTAIGQSISFRLLDKNSKNPVAEINAAKLTGQMLDETLAAMWQVLVEDEVKQRTKAPS